MQYAESPEVTGLWFCKACGNGERFIGVDDEGYPGDADEWEHDRTCLWLDDDHEICTCNATLTQPVHVLESLAEPTLEAAVARVIAHELQNPHSDMVDYDSHTGGVSGAEIGTYTQVLCGDCGEVLWAKAPDGAAP